MSSNLVNYKSTSSLHRNFDWLGSHWISWSASSRSAIAIFRSDTDIWYPSHLDSRWKILGEMHLPATSPMEKKSAAGAKHSTEIKLALVTGNLTCIPQLPRWKWPMGIGAPRSYVRLPKGSGRSGKCCFLQLLLAQAIWRLPVCLTQVWRVYHAARNGYTTHRGRLYTSHKWTWTAPHTTFDVDVGAIDPCVSIDLYTMFINVLLLFKSHNKLRPAQGQRSPPYGSVAQNQHSCHCECRALPSWQCRNSKRTSVASRRRSRSI